MMRMQETGAGDQPLAARRGRSGKLAGPSRTRNPYRRRVLGGEMPVAEAAPGACCAPTFARNRRPGKPQLRTGPDGVADTTFRLPDSLTAYRLTAVALTRDTEIGVGRASIRVSKPLAVQLLLPRFAVEGDRLQAVAPEFTITRGRTARYPPPGRQTGTTLEIGKDVPVIVHAGKTARVETCPAFRANRHGPGGIPLQGRRGVRRRDGATSPVQPAGPASASGSRDGAFRGRARA